MAAVTRITKSEKAEYAAYVEGGGTRSIKQYVALARGRAKSPVTQRLALAASQPTKAVKAVKSAPVSETLRTPAGQRVDLMGGHLVVDEAGANQLIAELHAAGFQPKAAGFQTSKRRGLRVQVDVTTGYEQAALAVADAAGFKTWAAA